MAVLTIPIAVHDSLAGQSFGQARYDVAETSGETGDTAINAGAPPRWTSSLRSAEGLTLDEAGAWEALLLRLRGGINYLAVYDKLRPAPRGTMRGAPMLAAIVPVGASVIPLTCMVGTLKAGDWLQLGAGVGSSQLVKVVADAASSQLVPGTATWQTSSSAVATWQTSSGAAATWQRGGSADVYIEPPTRYAYAHATSVAWDRPVAYMTPTNNRITWQASTNAPTVTGFAVDLVEQWG